MAVSGTVKIGNSYPLYVAGNFTVEPNTCDVVVALLTGSATLTLPALASSFNGYQLLIRNNSAAPQTLTVAGAGSDLIGSSNTTTVTQNHSLRILVDHVRDLWQILFSG